jgi:bifunctional non-homologous end joining protein LigD
MTAKRAISPMLATIGDAVPTGKGWTFEPKYDGMRVIAQISPSRIRLITRNGRDKSAQFPEVVAALKELANRVRRALVVDGEIVALRRNKPAPFQALQGRFHLKDAELIAKRSTEDPAAIVVFDVLNDGEESLIRRPWSERRMRLERAIQSPRTGALRISETSTSGARMIAKARAAGWEGVIAKRMDASYMPGARTDAWLKLKLQYREEFVVGGYTEPRRSRQHIGAILLGYYERTGALQYVGHTGGGFNTESLRDMHRRLARLERRTSPFSDRLRPNEPVHWVTPKVVVEVKFTEWTADGKLRQPIFLGVRDDKDPKTVHKERASLQHWAQEIGRGRGRGTAGNSRSAGDDSRRGR